MRQPASLLQGLEHSGILAVLRAPSAEHAVRAVDALVAGGVLGITAREFAAAYQSASSDRP